MSFDRLPFASGFGSQGFGSEQFGRLTAGDGWSQIRTGGGPALMSLLGMGGGTPPNALWLFETSITVATDLSGNGFNLSNDGTTLAAVVDSQLGGTAIEWDNNTSDRMIAAAAGTLDVTTGSVAVLQATRIIGGNPAGSRALNGKTDGNDGFETALLATGALRLDCRDGGVSETRASVATTYGDGNSFIVISGVDRTQASEMFLVSDRETRAQTNLTLASLTNSVVFQVGQTGNLQSAGKHTRLVAVWLSAGAEQGFAQGNCQSLKAGLSI